MSQSQRSKNRIGVWETKPNGSPLRKIQMPFIKPVKILKTSAEKRVPRLENPTSIRRSLEPIRTVPLGADRELKMTTN
jgi:hypothetical protein